MRNLKPSEPDSSAGALSPSIRPASYQPDPRGLRPVRDFIQDYLQKHIPNPGVRPRPGTKQKNRRKVLQLFVLTGCLFIQAAQATDVAPLGFPVGKATRGQVEASLKGKVDLKTLGTNKYSLGPMLSAPGRGFDLEGLKETLFVFDRDETLVAVQMQFDKDFMGDRFRKLYAYLRQKYTVTGESIPHVGDSWANFRKGDIVIELDAQHLGFTINVLYMTRDFEKRFRTLLKEERKDKKQREANKF